MAHPARVFLASFTWSTKEYWYSPWLGGWCIAGPSLPQHFVKLPWQLASTQLYPWRWPGMERGRSPLSTFCQASLTIYQYPIILSGVDWVERGRFPAPPPFTHFVKLSWQFVGTQLYSWGYTGWTHFESKASCPRTQLSNLARSRTLGSL